MSSENDRNKIMLQLASLNIAILYGSLSQVFNVLLIICGHTVNGMLCCPAQYVV